MLNRIHDNESWLTSFAPGVMSQSLITSANQPHHNKKIRIGDVIPTLILYDIVIYYQDRVQTSKIRTGDMDELLSLTDNQKISDVKSITVFEPPLRHSVIPQE